MSANEPWEVFVDGLLGEEGWPGYVDHPSDRGGETIAGISRRWHERTFARGWFIVDESKRLDDFPECLAGNAVLYDLVRKFYKKMYWDRVRGDDLWPVSQEVTLELLDASVQHDVPDAVEILQRSLNVRNKRQKLWPDIIDDGKMGRKTIAAIAASLRRRGEGSTVRGQRLVRAAYYMELAEADESQEDFLEGWINRLHIEVKARGGT